MDSQHLKNILDFYKNILNEIEKADDPSKIKIEIDKLPAIQYWNEDVFNKGHFHPTAGLPWEIGHHDKT